MVLGQFFTTNNAWYACFFPKWPSARKMKKHEILDHHYLSCNFSVQYGNLPAGHIGIFKQLMTKNKESPPRGDRVEQLISDKLLWLLEFGKKI
jgi:hypothetical protein